MEGFLIADTLSDQVLIFFFKYTVLNKTRWDSIFEVCDISEKKENIDILYHIYQKKKIGKIIITFSDMMVFVLFFFL